LPLLPDYNFKISYGAGDDRLHDFYIPALSASVRFDRSTGFFSSAALAIAAAGIARLIANGGHLRLLCGAELSDADVEAIGRGEEAASVVDSALRGCLDDPADQSQRARLEALAWMIAHDDLEIRVVLPTGADGLPLSAESAREYFHIKEGVFADAAGNRLAFSGSSNDTENGWKWNYESFDVYATWPRRQGADEIPALVPYVRQVEERFRRLWEGTEPDWIALPVPRAAREGLLKYCPDEPPTRDPFEEPVAAAVPAADEERGLRQRERIVFAFLRAAPYLAAGERLGRETGNVVPWPHQARTVDETVSRFPQGLLFCDEVGLGKTIEAGLALRELLLSGRVERALILTPKSVLRQWQEELWEKFVLNVPRYDGGVVRDVFNHELSWEGSPWGAFPLLLASSQLAKRRERQAEVVAAGPWDLVIVDEVHHARRMEFLSGRYRPNRLLELLMGTDAQAGLRDRTDCLYLLTATPMQVSPLEVWDLLKVLGLGGRWGAYEGNFLAYFEELRTAYEDRDWDFLLDMLADHLLTGGAIDEATERAATERIGHADWQAVRELPFMPRHARRTTVMQLAPEARAVLDQVLRRATPLRALMWRNTRRLLRRYREVGIITENVPVREPRNEWIELQTGPGGERELYERIEEYISEFYQKYEAERKGLGFIMTVYRRRLTSSFYALERSLERRLEFLRGASGLAEIVGDDDLEQDDLDLDVSEELAEEGRELFAAEREYVERFIHDLRALPGDSKFERLSGDLSEIFAKRDKVLVFTQYTDTMDYLRERLRPIYGAQVACYSGRGGERWDGMRWALCPKEEIKAAFREGDELKILLCTESASEGLNLQTCGVLINYDMPWNPMRVEQRIGRIDRIGQTHARVWVRNYFFADTVEADVYRRLSDRIDWFQEVVGELQPILQRVATTIQEVAMLSGPERDRRLEEEVASLRRAIDEHELGGLDIDAFAEPEVAAPAAGTAPVTLAELERALTGSSALGARFRADGRREGVYRLDWDGCERSVTFARDAFDRYPNSVELLSYGSELLGALLEAVEAPAGAGAKGGLAFVSVRGGGGADVFDCRDVFRCADGRPVAIETLAELEKALEYPSLADAVWTDEALAAGRRHTAERQARAAERERAARERRLRGEQLALEERARMILVRTALLKLALQRASTLFGDENQAATLLGFGEEPVQALREEGVPYPGLWKLAGQVPLSAEASDPYYLEVSALPEKSLRTRLDNFRREGLHLLGRYKEVEQKLVEVAEARRQLDDIVAEVTVVSVPAVTRSPRVT